MHLASQGRILFGRLFTYEISFRQRKLLNSDQIDEWKGWMMFTILVYNYTGAEKVCLAWNNRPFSYSEKESETAFTRCRHILKTVKNMTVAKFELAFTRYRHTLRTVGNLTVKLVARL